MLGEWTDHSGQYGRHANGVFFRRTLTQLDETIERAKEIFYALGAVWRDQTCSGSTGSIRWPWSSPVAGGSSVQTEGGECRNGC